MPSRVNPSSSSYRAKDSLRREFDSVHRPVIARLLQSDSPHRRSLVGSIDDGAQEGISK